jgi:hypothetical protein
MRRFPIALLIVMLVALLVIAGCGPSTPSGSTATATATGPVKATLCNGVTTIHQTLTSLSNVTVSTTVGDVKAAQAKVSNAVTTNQQQHPADPQGLVGQVSAANDKHTEKLAGYPDQTPIGQTSETVQDVKAKVADAQTRTQQLSTELKCAP